MKGNNKLKTDKNDTRGGGYDNYLCILFDWACTWRVKIEPQWDKGMKEFCTEKGEW